MTNLIFWVIFNLLTAYVTNFDKSKIWLSGKGLKINLNRLWENYLFFVFQTFLQWLSTFMLNCLYPGSTFPRRTTALNSLSLLIDTFNGKYKLNFYPAKMNFKSRKMNSKVASMSRFVLVWMSPDSKWCWPRIIEHLFLHYVFAIQWLQSQLEVSTWDFFCWCNTQINAWINLKKISLLCVTLSLMTNFRLFQTERVFRWQFQIW